MANSDINLSFLSLNVNGMRNNKTRQALFRSFKCSNIDIIALQETHLTDNDYHTIECEWNGRFHLSSDTSRSKGLLTLFNKSVSHLECKLLNKTERIMSSSIKVDLDKTLIITNIYAPCDTIYNRVTFFEELKYNLLALHDEHDLDFSMSVILGDFNCCMDNNLDIISGNKHPASLVAKFNDFVNCLNIHDIFRVTYPSLKEYTWSRKEDDSILSCRRLDYIFTSDALLPYVKNVDIKLLVSVTTEAY